MNEPLSLIFSAENKVLLNALNMLTDCVCIIGMRMFYTERFVVLCVFHQEFRGTTLQHFISSASSNPCFLKLVK